MARTTAAEAAMAGAYALAQQFLPWGSAARSVRNASVLPFWPTEPVVCFRRDTRDGWEFVSWREGIPEPAPSFDHSMVAQGLSPLLGSPVDPRRLPFFCFERSEDVMRFNINSRSFEANLRSGAVREAAPQRTSNSVRSPDGRWIASIVDNNVHLRPAEQPTDRQLTQDGLPLHSYGAWPEGNLFELSRRSGAIVLPPPIGWSPDSRYFVTHLLDQTDVKPLHLLDSVSAAPGGRPMVHSYRYALPADAERPLSTMFVVDALTGTLTPLDIPALQSVVLPPVAGLGYWWSANSESILVVRWLKGRNRIELHAADPVSGRARVLVTEESAAWLRPTHNFQGSPNIRYLAGTHELIWYSERSGWAHLYLLDAACGTQKAVLTSGDWLVDSILHVDEDRRRVYFSARGRESGRDPYERYVYRVNLDGSDLVLLTPEPGDHLVHVPAPETAYSLGGDEAILVARGFSPAGELFIESYSRLDVAPVTRARRSQDGAILTDLVRADVSALERAGWRPPQRVQVKGRDGRTDIYGTLWAPLALDPAASYPLIDAVYPGPHVNLAPTAFTVPNPKSYFWPESLAALGFAVLMLDGMGTPFRRRAFVDFAYGNLGDAGLPDHVAAFSQLKAQFAWLDTDRIGVIGTSAGGYAAARAMFQFPETFKVGVAGCGAHDIRLIHAAWAEILQGTVHSDVNALERLSAAASNYDVADRLQGKLFIVHGDMDENVHPAVSLRLVDQLIRANRDFDFLLLPGRGHNFRNDPYFVRRAVDYLVRHLMGCEPPPQFSFVAPAPSSV